MVTLKSESERLGKLRVLRSHAKITLDAAQETLAQIDAQIDECIRRIERLGHPPSGPVQRLERFEQTGGGRPTNASQEQRLIYWAVFHSGGHAMGMPMTYDKFAPWLYGAATPNGKPCPSRQEVEKRLARKAAGADPHVMGDPAAGWRLTARGEQSMRLQADTTVELVR